MENYGQSIQAGSMKTYINKNIKIGGTIMTDKEREVYDKITLKNLKRAKLQQKEAELELAEKYNNIEKITQLDNEIEQLKKELQ